jgi:hypothetical protein
MSRVELAGLGGPIPTVALSDPNLDENLAPQAFLLTTGNFLKADWVGLGYTHYEVMCIGGAGGNGSDGGSGIAWPYYYTPPTPTSGGHLIQHWYDAFVGTPQIFGGAGGGGGLHRVAGLLADLPAVTPVVVGAAGAQGVRGDVGHQNSYAPTPPPIYPHPNVIWDPPHLMIPVPTMGQDGEASSFGDVCVASGGKGGFPATVWDVTRPSSGYNFPGEVGAAKPDGRGGQGGKGGQAAAGGGGAGAFFTLVPAPFGSTTRTVTQAKDGTWDGVVGEGGGGGLAGEYMPGWRPIYSVSSASAPKELAPDELMHGLYDDIIIEATPGAKGSFSYSDTSVYGQRQDRQFGYSENPAPRSTMEKVSPLVFIRTPTPYLIVPGCGGGARINKSQGFGSRAPGFSPDGAVLIRVTKID